MKRVVHLGLGAFHRAHQAVYTEDAGGWEIAGVAQRSRAVIDALRAQDHRYALLDGGGPYLVAAFFFGLAVISFVAFLFSAETKDVDIGEMDPEQREIVSTAAVTEEPLLSR